MLNFTSLLTVLQYLAAGLGIAASIKTLLRPDLDYKQFRRIKVMEHIQVWKCWRHETLEELKESKASNIRIFTYKIRSYVDLFFGLLLLYISKALNNFVKNRYRRPKR